MEGPAQDSAAAPPSWSAQGLWVWSQLARGLPANFNAAEGYGGDLDPRKTDNWPANRTLSPQFLQAILFAKQNQEALTWHGVYIEGARFEQPVDLSNGRLGCVLILHRCRFDSYVNLSRLEGSRVVSFKGSTIAGHLSMRSLRLSDDLLLGEDSELDEVDLSSARIEGQLSLHRARVMKKLNLDSVVVGGSVLMDSGTFAEARLVNAVIEGQANLGSATFHGIANLNGIRIGRSLYLRDGAHFEADLILVGAHVGGQIAANGSKFDGVLDLNSITIGKSLLLGGTEGPSSKFHRIESTAASIGGQVNGRRISVADKFSLDSAQVGGHVLLAECPSINGLDMHGTTIGGQIDLSDSTFSGGLQLEAVAVQSYLMMLDTKVESGDAMLKFSRIAAINCAGSTFAESMDLTGARIAGELRLGQTGYATRWSEKSALALRNASAAALHDTEDSWPPRLDLTGFTYERLGATVYGKASESELLGRGVGWFKGWLNRQQRYSPQPYEQLAEVLVTAGAREKADAILYEGRDRERRETLRGAQWLWASALDLFIGYGYRSLSRIFFIWLPVFTLAGMLALTVAISTGTLNATFAPDLPSSYFNDIGHRFSYSLDKFLPVMKLRDYHYSKIRLDGWLGYYFDFQQVMGYFLGSMLVAGITGIAKRSRA